MAESNITGSDHHRRRWPGRTPSQAVIPRKTGFIKAKIRAGPLGCSIRPRIRVLLMQNRAYGVGSPEYRSTLLMKICADDRGFTI